jgi:hypothetical protein
MSSTPVRGPCYMNLTYAIYGSAGDTAALRVGWGGAWVGGCIHRQQARKSGGEMEPPSPSTGKLAPVKSACEERL